MLAIINSAAEAYRGQIPDDCWHEPYMGRDELEAELVAGIVFSGIEVEGQLAAIMGIQPVRNVRLVRHAYVLPGLQGIGLGGQLIEQVCGDYAGQILVGTWRAARWAIRFYERHGFETVPESSVAPLLRGYWRISDRQIETSIVLARPALDEDAVRRLVGGERTRQS